jgi:hypothetical protein
VRCNKSGTFLYGFADASGPAFGGSAQVGDEIRYQYGQWITQVSEEETSNWRELGNLLEFIKDLVGGGEFEGFELFIFTDNSTAENAFWKGTSTSRRLYELVLELRTLEHEHGLILHVIHVSGKRMIAQGTDGLSRANHWLGVMKGLGMVQFMPLHEDPFDREPRLKKWMEDLTSGLDAEFLSPEDWFDKGHGHGTFVWSAPPAAADVVVEQLGRARLKRPESMHIVVVPRVMTGRWRKHMTRGTDFYFRLDSDKVWPLKEHFEPLLIFVCLPYSSSAPRLSEKNLLLEELRGALLRSKLPEIPEVQRWNFLRKLLRRARALCSV